MFRVVITGKQNDYTNEAVEAALATLFKATLEQARVVLSSSRYVVKAGLTEEIASQYQSAIRATGALCLIEDEAKVLNLDADLPKIEKAPATDGIAPQSTQIISKTSWSTYIWIFVGIFSVVFFGGKLWTWGQTRGESPPTSISGLFASVKAYGAADQIIQSQLTSPGSYKAVRHDLLWSSTLGAESAYIVRAEYDAQNGFGAMLRGCQYVSFVITGEKFSYNRRDGQQQCDLDRDNVNWSSEQEKLIPFLIKNFGLDRFVSAADKAVVDQPGKTALQPQPLTKNVADTTLVGVVVAPQEQGDPFTLKMPSTKVFAGDPDCGKEEKAEIFLWDEAIKFQPYVGEVVTVTGHLDCPRGAYVLTSVKTIKAGPK